MTFKNNIISILGIAILGSGCKKNADISFVDGNWKATNGTASYTQIKQIKSSNFVNSLHDFFPQGFELTMDDKLVDGVFTKSGTLVSYTDSLNKKTIVNASNSPYEFNLQLNNDSLSYTLKVKDVSYGSYQIKIWKTNDENDNEDLGIALIEYTTTYEYSEKGTYLFDSNSKGYKGGKQLVLTPDSSTISKNSSKNFTRVGSEPTYNPDSVFYIDCYCIVMYYENLSKINYEEDIVVATQLLRYAYPPFKDNRYFNVEEVDKETFKLSATSSSSDDFSVVEGSFEFEMKKE